MRLWLVLIVSLTSVGGCKCRDKTEESSEAAVAGAKPKPAVVYRSPENEATNLREVVAIFNREMDTSKKVLQIRPAVPGKTFWIGKHTVVFVSSTSFPKGKYRVSIPEGTKTSAGGALAAEVSWRFEASVVQHRVDARSSRKRRRIQAAKPLRVVSAKIEGGSELSTARSILLRFNVPVAQWQVEQSASLLLPSGAKVTFEATQAPDSDQRFVRLTSIGSLPEKGEVQLWVKEGLSALEGEVLKTTFKKKFPTRAELTVSDVRCPQSAAATLQVDLTAEIAPAVFLGRLKVRPPVRLSVRTGATSAQTIALGGPFKPGESYSIEVPKGLAGKKGLPLAKAHRTKCEIPLPKPALRFAVEGSLIEGGDKPAVPVWAERVAKIAVRLRRIPNDRLPAILRKPEDADALAVTARRTITGAPGLLQERWVDLGPALRGGTGVVQAEIEGLDAKGRTIDDIGKRVLLNVTDLGLTTKQSRSGVLVWVTRLSSGRPVPGAAVSLLDRDGQVLAKGTTATDGAVVLRAKKLGRYGDYYVIAEKGNDKAYHRTTENQWMFVPSSFDVQDGEVTEDADSGGRPRLRGLLFTDRGIYRPGATLRLKGIVRRERDRLETPAATKVRVSVEDSQGEEVLDRTVRLSSYGTFAVQTTLPASAPLGAYSARIEKSGWSGRIRRGFRVDKFRTPTFKVKALPSRRHWYAGESPRVTVRGRYFFGGAMSRAPVSWTVTATPNLYSPPKHPGYIWRPLEDFWMQPTAAVESSKVTSDEGFLDARGAREIKLRKVRGNRIYSIAATVSGLDRTQITGRATLVVHPSRIYLGLLPEWTIQEVTETFRADLVTVAPDGTRVPGVPIEAVIYRGTWDSVRQLHQSGASSFASRAAPSIVGRCSLRSESKPVRCEFKPKAGGAYVLWATARTKGGKKVESATSFHVIGPSSTSWAASTDVKVTLRADRHEYRVGQTARILVQNPFPSAEALVTLERDKILKRFRARLEGPAPGLKIPVTEDLMPNVYVSVVLVRGRQPGPRVKSGDDPRRPMMRVGHTNLRVSADSRRLKVTLQTNRREYRPGARVRVSVSTVDQSGRPAPAEVTLWAVDEGVLSLVDYRTPDPVSALHVLQGLDVMSSDSRYRLLKRQAFKREKGASSSGDGGGGANPAAILRKLFKTVVYFNPSLRTGSDGRAVATFKLPDNLTTFRIMAVAVTKGQRFGSAQRKILSNKRLMAKAALPRFLRAGDQFEGGVVVHNRTRKAGRVKVEAKVSGVEVLGRTSSSVRVAAGDAAEVRFRFRAKKPGRAKLRFTAKMRRLRDAVELKRTIQLPSVVEHAGVSGEAKGKKKQTHALRLPASREDTGGLAVVLSGSRLVGLTRAMAYLIEYPYGCAEQTSSKLLGLLALSDLARVTGAGAARKVKPMIKSGLGKLASFQHDTGGFAFWPGADHADPWISAYVLRVVGRAKELGYAVDGTMIKRAVAYLRELVRGGIRDEDKALGASTRAYALYALSAFGAATKADGATVFERRGDMGIDGKAALTRALVRIGDRKRAADVIRTLVSAVKQRGASLRDRRALMLHCYGSPVRTQAMVLEALVAYDPSHPMTQTLYQRILAARGPNDRWQTTQETAYALFALAAADRAEQAKRDRRATVWVNGDKHEIGFSSGAGSFQKVWVPRSKLKGDVVRLVVLGRGGPVRYSARLSYVPIHPPKALDDHGLTVYRTFEPVAAPTRGEASFATPSATTFAAGSMVRVTLHIVAPRALRHVVVDDPLPAGLEALNMKLATEQRIGADAEDVEEVAPDPTPRDEQFTHRETHDDRVILYARKLPAGLHRRTYFARAITPGSFALPAARTEAMYRPEVRGRTPAGRVVVATAASGVARP